MMKNRKWLKVGQVAGVLFMAAGVMAFQLRDDDAWLRAMPILFLVGILLYGGCRVTAWLTKDD